MMSPKIYDFELGLRGAHCLPRQPGAERPVHASWFTVALSVRCLPVVAEGTQSVRHWLLATVGQSCHWLIVQFMARHGMQTKFIG